MRKRMIILVALVIAVGSWFVLNPQGKFGICFPGLTTFSGIPVPLRDLQVRPDGQWHTATGMPALTAENLEWLLEDKPPILIIGNGWDGKVIVDPSLRSIKDCEVQVMPSGEAVKAFNGLRKERRRVAVHLCQGR